MADMFRHFGDRVAANYASMQASELHVVDVADLWGTYLQAFPAGTDPIHVTRTQHDCSCCKNFVRSLGAVVRLKADGSRDTVWDQAYPLPHPYDEVASRMREVILQAPVRGLHRTKERKYGAEETLQHADGSLIRWRHFHGTIAVKHLTPTPEKAIGDAATKIGVFRRGMEEITQAAIETVKDLIAEGQLYRGEEYQLAVSDFWALWKSYPRSGSQAERDAFLWTGLERRGALFRNTVIGSLVTDLSEGVDVEKAVRQFESKVAPENYKRPKPVVSQRMIDDAILTVREHGLESALERRHAQLRDVSVTDVLFVDGSARPAMKGGLEGLLADAPVRVSRKPSAETGRKISIRDFLTEVLPGATSLSVTPEAKHAGNYVSLTAPVHDDANRLFKWAGGLSWSYDGDATDSIRERVKRAGGRVDVPLRASLSWSNYDDLDLHCVGPEGHVFFNNKCGILDVDMNAGYAKTREPVENLQWPSPRDGSYHVWVNQYNRRERIDVGFEIQHHWRGETRTFSYPKEVSGDVQCFKFDIVRGEMINFQFNLALTEGPRTGSVKWGVQSGVPAKVNVLMHSPNYHGESALGNRHWFFVLDGCLNPDPVRSIYNEFLRSDLQAHGRVFELLGSRTKAPYSPDQLSGLGFTAGRGDAITATVRGERGGAYRIEF